MEKFQEGEITFLSFNKRNTYTITSIDIFCLEIPRIFLEHSCIFLQVNVTFYDVVNMIHDVIRTADPFPYTAKFMSVGVRNSRPKTQQIRRRKINRIRT